MLLLPRSLAGLVSLLLLSTWAHSVAAERRVVAYVPNWIDLDAFSKTIDYSRITHLNLAFENPVSDDGDLSFNRKDDSLIANARAHKIPVLVSIGGGGASSNKALLARYFTLISDAKRSDFIAKLSAYVAEHQFDGIDVDLEGPSINKDYGAFVRDLATELHAKGKLITAALSKGYGGSKVPDSVFAHFDFVNIMAYDGAGPWNPKAPGQHSSFDFAKENVAYWLERGLPKSKAVLGVPFYGYGFGEAFRKRDYPYSALVQTYLGAEQRDETGSTIWYNGIPTIRAKSQYVVDQNLGGIMIWSLDYDAKGEHSLLSTIYDALNRRRDQ